MHFTSRLDDAVRLASRLHRSQIRKDKNDTPYISHLVSVAILLSEVTEDEDILIAGLLHDSLEDVPGYTKEMLTEAMGERVTSIVLHVTEPLDASKEYDEQLPWLERKETYLRVLEEGGVESALVSCADKIHNTESYIKDIKGYGHEEVKKMHSSARNRLWFHEQVYEVVKKKLGEDNHLVKKFFIANQVFKDLVEKMQEGGF